MIDQLYDRNYQAARTSLNRDIGRALDALFKAAAHAFTVLSRIQFAAPWNERRAENRCR